MKILRVLAVALLAALFLAGAGVAYLLAPATIPQQSSYVVDREGLERAAGEISGPLPVRVNHVKVADAAMPRAALFSGFDFSPHAMVHGAYQVVYPDGSYVLVDACFGRSTYEQMAGEGDGSYYADTFDALTRALPQARKVIITHEHLDHIQGLDEVESLASLAPRVFLNRAQHENPDTAELLSAELLAAIEPQDAEGARAIAPGIAVFPAAGHTPGSQLVFVKLEDDRGFLFIGDVAWHMDMIRKLEYRPRLVTDLVLGEDRDAVMGQLRTLHGMLDDPAMLVVASHDAEQLAALQRAGTVGSGLEIR